MTEDNRHVEASGRMHHGLLTGGDNAAAAAGADHLQVRAVSPAHHGVPPRSVAHELGTAGGQAGAQRGQPAVGARPVQEQGLLGAELSAGTRGERHPPEVLGVPHPLRCDRVPGGVAVLQVQQPLTAGPGPGQPQRPCRRVDEADAVQRGRDHGTPGLHGGAVDQGGDPIGPALRVEAQAEGLGSSLEECHCRQRTQTVVEPASGRRGIRGQHGPQDLRRVCVGPDPPGCRLGGEPRRGVGSRDVEPGAVEVEQRQTARAHEHLVDREVPVDQHEGPDGRLARAWRMERSARPDSWGAMAVTARTAALALRAWLASSTPGKVAAAWTWARRRPTPARSSGSGAVVAHLPVQEPDDADGAVAPRAVHGCHLDAGDRQGPGGCRRRRDPAVGMHPCHGDRTGGAVQAGDQPPARFVPQDHRLLGAGHEVAGILHDPTSALQCAIGAQRRHEDEVLGQLGREVADLSRPEVHGLRQLLPQ